MVAGLLALFGCEAKPSPCIPSAPPEIVLPVRITTCQLNDTQRIPCEPPKVECPNLPPGDYRMVVRSTTYYRDALGELRATDTGEDSWEWTVTE